MIFDNLIDSKTGKPVEIDEPVNVPFKDLEEVRKVASEAGKRFRKAFGIEGEVTPAHVAEAHRLIDTIENDEGEPLVFNDKP